MATINGLQNVIGAANVGIGTSFFNPDIILGGFLVPKGYKIKDADLATLQTKLLQDAQNSSKSARIYPIKNLLEFKDNSEKAVEQSYGYGGKAVVRDGAYTWQFMFIKGGLSLLAALRQFNGANWDFFFVDKRNILIGQKILETDGTLSLQAIPSIQFYAEPWGANDGKKNTDYLLDFSFMPQYVNEQVGFIADAGFSILDTINGLINMNLSVTASATSGTYTVVIKDDMKVNLYGQLQGLNVANLWSAINKQTGAVIDITAVNLNAAADGGNGGFDVVLSKADTDYPSGVSDKVTINTVGASALYTGSIVGFESAGAVSCVKN